MGRPRVFTGRLLLGACAIACASAAWAGEPLPPGGPEQGPPRNAALPHPDDLVSFDSAPVAPGLILELDELGLGQAAFPALYGAVPVTPASGMYDRGVTASPPPAPPTMGEGTADIVAGSAHIIPTNDSGEFVEYQRYLEQAGESRGTGLAAPAAGGPPAPDVDGPTGTGQAFIPPVPFSEPLARAIPERDLPDAAGAPAPTEAAPGTTAAPGMEPLPLPPPPLPDLPSHRAPRPDLNRVRAEFAQLKEFCETDSLGDAAGTFAAMPPFGEDEELNRIRADAANLLILALCRSDNLPAARRVYESLPVRMHGFEAMLAKARVIINLTTYYVRAKQYDEAYTVLMDIGTIQNRSALNNELFRLMARMIPYLDNADETEKALSVYDLLLGEVKSPGTAALFADNAHGVIRYYLHFIDNSESPARRRVRLEALEHIYDSLIRLSTNQDIADLRRGLGMDLAERFAGNPERAGRFRAGD